MSHVTYMVESCHTCEWVVSWPPCVTTIDILHSTATHDNTLQHTTPHWNTLPHTAAHCNTPHHTATHCNTLHHTAVHCVTLQHTAPHRTTLHHTATHCTTLHHTATHCIPLHHTATHLVRVFGVGAAESASKTEIALTKFSKVSSLLNLLYKITTELPFVKFLTSARL